MNPDDRYHPDPYVNKALAALGSFAAGTAVQFITTDLNFELKEEGVTIVTGLVAAALVWTVSNVRRLSAQLLRKD